MHLLGSCRDVDVCHEHHTLLLQGSESGVQDSRSRDCVLGMRFEVELNGAGFRVQDSGFGN